jgi:hypothetical protein
MYRWLSCQRLPPERDRPRGKETCCCHRDLTNTDPVIPNEVREEVVPTGGFENSKGLDRVHEARGAFGKLKPLAKVTTEKRGWTLDVLNAVRSINRLEFTLDDVYAHEMPLAQIHPKNSHIRAKIRQQLQVLRDLGLIALRGNGRYKLC